MSKRPMPRLETRQASRFQDAGRRAGMGPLSFRPDAPLIGSRVKIERETSAMSGALV